MSFLKRKKPSVFKVLLLDVDGVLTTGRKLYGPDGKTALKEFNDKDFTAIKKFNCLGIPVVFISGDETVNKEIAKNRAIQFIFSRGIPKATHLPKLEKQFNVSRQEMAYVGDDTFDLDILKEVGYPYAPCDAPKDVCDVSTLIYRGAGLGVIAKLFDDLVERKQVEQPSLEALFERDKKDVF